MHKKLKQTPVWNKKLVKRGIPHMPNRKGAMQKAWSTAPYQKWPKKMPGACPACCRTPNKEPPQSKNSWGTQQSSRRALEGV